MAVLSRRSVLALAAGTACGARVRAEEPLAAEKYWLLPLRIHLLRAKDAPDLDCTLKPEDARRILKKINGIWKQAGIQFYEESVLTEDAENQRRYSLLGADAPLGHLRIVRPEKSLSEDVFQLYYIHKMRPNGVTLGPSYQLLFVKDTARLRPVAGGIDEDLPRVSAHEIGHALGLPHRQDTFNLMASGTTGTSLNEAEIETTRTHAAAFKFALKAPEALAAAEKNAAAGEKEKAAALYTALAGLPDGEITKAAKAHAEAAPKP